MKTYYRQVYLLIILVLSLSCTLPLIQKTPTDGQDFDNSQQGNTVRSVTPTPFPPQAGTDTSTITPTALATITPTYGPSPTPAPWYENLTKPEGQFNILVLGSDYRPSSGFRTDIILILSFNPDKKSVTAVSFPRDLWVNIPGFGEGRINTAQARGGFSLMADTLESNFGVRPDRYIITNMAGFVSIVNKLGGVNVQVSQQLSDTCNLPQASNGYCSVSPGVVTMNGQTALWYVRSRYSSNDFSRTRRAQEVMVALLKKLLSLNAVTRLPEMYEVYKQNVETDLLLTEILSLAPLATNLLEPGNLNQYFIGPEQVTGYVIPNSGANVLLPRQDAIRKLITEAFFTP